MNTASLSEQILHDVQSLSDTQQRQVLAYVRELQKDRNKSGAAVANLAGSIPPDDLLVMEKAIEEDCERIDADGW